MIAHALLLALVINLLRLVQTTTQNEIAALETLYTSTGGSAGSWNFTSMNACILKGATGTETLDLTGAAWDFTKSATGYEMDPCAARSSGKNFAGIGCTCSASNVCSITQISLPCGNLAGSLESIVTALQIFTQLSFLDLYKNPLTGSIPRQLGDLKKLQSLKLFKSLLTGPIPQELGSLTQLKRLDLDQNSLTGQIPKEIGNLVQMETLWLAVNPLQGTIPPEIGNMTSLQRLYLFRASITGSIPRQLSSLANLALCFLYENALTGSLPSSLGNLKKLSSLRLFKNSLTGSLPGELGELPVLEKLSLDSNSLKGQIPPNLGKARSLRDVYLHSNSLSGSIPPALSRLTGLQVLSIQENSLTGSIPPEMGQCKSLMTIDLSKNALAGTIPSNFSALSKLQRFFVQGNNLQSSTTESGAFNFLDPLVQRNFSLLDISHNNFTGSISEALFALPSLHVLFMGSNCFSGTLPSNICSATKLITLDLSSLSSGSSCRKYIWAGTAFEHVFTSFIATKHMRGSLPSCTYRLPRLRVLNANGNNLLGMIPMTISPSLEMISLSRNKFDGTISASLATSENLVLLDLSYNHVGGDLSAFASTSDDQLSARKNMALQLQINYLSGDIPESLHDLNPIHILSGNVFSCSASRSEIPIHTTKRDSYQCGSNDMNPMMYAFGIGSFVVVIILVCMKQVTGMEKYFVKFDTWYRVADGRKRLNIYVNGRALVCDEIETTEMMRYTRSLQAQRWFACMIGVSMIIVTICFASLANNSNQTVSISYAWVVTMAFLTGKTSTIVLLSCGILFLCFVWYLIYQDKRVAFHHHHTREEDRISILINKNDQKERNTTLSTKLRTIMIPVLRLLLLFSFILGTIVGGNLLYVIIQLGGSTSDQKLFQFCFALFRLLWSMKAMPYLLESEKFHFGIAAKHHDALERSVFGGRHRVLFMMNVLITFVIPLVTVVFVDDSCFYNLLYPPDPMVTSTLIDDCVVYFADGSCALKGDYVSTSTTVAPFKYGYTCSDSIIRIYIPLYMQMSILLLIKSAVALAYLFWTANEEEKAPLVEKSGKLGMFMDILRSVVPNKHILLNNNRRRVEYSPGRVFRTRIKKWITRGTPGTLVNMLILLTFGLAAPPLAVMMITYLILDSCVYQVAFGRFMESEMGVLLEYKRQAVAVMETESDTEARKRARMQDAIKDIDEPWGARAALQEVEAQCRFVPTSIFVHGRFSFIVITSSLLALKLIDVQNSSLSNDTVSVWAAITILSFACTLALCTKIYSEYKAHMSANKLEADARSSIQQIGIEITSFHDTSSIAGAKLPTLKNLKEVHTLSQTDVYDYRVGGDELEEGEIRNPVQCI